MEFPEKNEPEEPKPSCSKDFMEFPEKKEPEDPKPSCSKVMDPDSPSDSSRDMIQPQSSSSSAKQESGISSGSTPEEEKPHTNYGPEMPLHRKELWVNCNPIYFCNLCGLVFADEFVYYIHIHAHSRVSTRIKCQPPIWENRMALYTCVCEISCEGDRLSFYRHLLERPHDYPELGTWPEETPLRTSHSTSSSTPFLCNAKIQTEEYSESPLFTYRKVIQRHIESGPRSRCLPSPKVIQTLIRSERRYAGQVTPERLSRRHQHPSQALPGRDPPARLYPIFNTSGVTQLPAAIFLMTKWTEITTAILNICSQEENHAPKSLQSTNATYVGGPSTSSGPSRPTASTRNYVVDILPSLRPSKKHDTSATEAVTRASIPSLDLPLTSIHSGQPTSPAARDSSVTSSETRSTSLPTKIITAAKERLLSIASTSRTSSNVYNSITAAKHYDGNASTSCLPLKLFTTGGPTTSGDNVERVRALPKPSPSRIQKRSNTNISGKNVPKPTSGDNSRSSTAHKILKTPTASTASPSKTTIPIKTTKPGRRVSKSNSSDTSTSSKTSLTPTATAQVGVNTSTSQTTSTFSATPERSRSASTTQHFDAMPHDMKLPFLQKYDLLECRHCLILFDYYPMHAMHMSVHTEGDPWNCTCGNFNNADRRLFSLHCFMCEHKITNE